jgi:hypothetical protein
MRSWRQQHYQELMKTFAEDPVECLQEMKFFGKNSFAKWIHSFEK